MVRLRDSSAIQRCIHTETQMQPFRGVIFREYVGAHGFASCSDLDGIIFDYLFVIYGTPANVIKTDVWKYWLESEQSLGRVEKSERKRESEKNPHQKNTKQSFTGNLLQATSRLVHSCLFSEERIHLQLSGRLVITFIHTKNMNWKHKQTRTKEFAIIARICQINSQVDIVGK